MKCVLDIVIVNWNAGPQLERSISSIAMHGAGLVKSVIVVDNGSTDDSLDLIANKDGLPFSLILLKNAENIGFGAACNQGAQSAKGEFLLFLNPDAHLYPDSLIRPLDFLRHPDNSGIGIVGIKLIEEGGRVARSCARFPSARSFVAQALGLSHFPFLAKAGMHMTDWDHEDTREVDHVIGAFYLMRRALFQLVGGFDERFFVYLEDLDLSLRIRQAGFRSLYLSDARAFHEGGGTSKQVKARRLFYSLRSRIYYGFKHFGRLDAWVLVLVTLLVEPMTRTIFSVARGKLSDARNTWQAYALLYADLAQILRQARET